MAVESEKFKICRVGWQLETRKSCNWCQKASAGRIPSSLGESVFSLKILS
jgi:hypothetical protein